MSDAKRKLSDCIRPTVEAAPWVIASIAEQEIVITGLRQQLNSAGARLETVKMQRDMVKEQLVTLKTEIKSIGEAIDDPRTDLTMTMSELILEYKQQLAAALAAIKVKDAAIQIAVDYAHNFEEVDFLVGENALAIQPDDSALKQWLGEPLAWMAESGTCVAEGERMNKTYFNVPLYSPKGIPE